MISTNLKAKLAELSQIKFKTREELRTITNALRIQFPKLQELEELAKEFDLSNFETLDFLINERKTNPKILHKINDYFNHVCQPLNIELKGA